MKDFGKTFIEVQRMNKAELLAYTREIEGIAATLNEQVENPTAAFWLVWRDGCNSTPHLKHFKREDAVREAERLSGQHPGERFYVLPATSFARTEISPVSWLDAREVAVELPF